MGNILDFQHVTTTICDQEKSLWFYRDMLGFKRAGRLSYHDARDFVIDFMEIGNNYLLELFYFKPELYKSTERIGDDRQVGMRHIGFSTRNLDHLIERLKQAGVEVVKDPVAGHGRVRFAVVKDPSGTMIELIEGAYHYDDGGMGSAGANSTDENELIFDHLAITVANAEQSIDYYHNIFKFPYLGRISVENSPDGMVIDHFQIGKAIVALLSFNTPTISYRRNHDNTHLGLRHYGLLVDKVDPVMERLKTAGAPILYPPVNAIGGVRTCFFSDADTVAIELINGTCNYDE